MAQAFRHVLPQLAGDENRRLVGLQVVEIGSLLPSDFKQVAKSRAGDEAGQSAPMLDQRVCRDRRTVAEIGDLTGRRTDLGEAVGDRMRHPVGRIGWSGRDFPDGDAARGFVEQTDIGEGAAGIDTDTPRHKQPRDADWPYLDGPSKTTVISMGRSKFLRAVGVGVGKVTET